MSIRRSANSRSRFIRRARYLERPAWQTLIEIAESILGSRATRDPPSPIRVRFGHMLWPRWRDWVRIVSGENEFWFIWTQPNTSPNSIPGMSQPDFEIKKTVHVSNEHREVHIANFETKNISSRTIIDYEWFDREIHARFSHFLAPSNILITSFFNLVRRSRDPGDLPLIQYTMEAYHIDVIELGFQAGQRDAYRVRELLAAELRPRLERILLEYSQERLESYLY